ncbi:MAG: hypothetical protein BWY77_00796 [bacterium ADurb.Bin431]|nr:MAG: hypothetical protein BWY77_00796 [bacterium ADurb.Bin431]
MLQLLALASGDQFVVSDDGHSLAPLLGQGFGLILDQFGDHPLGLFDRLHRQPADGHLHAVVVPLEIGVPVVAGSRGDLGGLRAFIGGNQIGSPVAVDIAKVVVTVPEEQNVAWGSPVGIGIGEKIAHGDGIGQTPAEFVIDVRNPDHLGFKAVAGVPVFTQALELHGLLVEIVVSDDDIVDVARPAQIGGCIPADLRHRHVGGRGQGQIAARALSGDLIGEADLRPNQLRPCDHTYIVKGGDIVDCHLRPFKIPDLV